MRNKDYRLQQLEKKKKNRAAVWKRVGWEPVEGKFSKNHYSCGCYYCKPYKWTNELKPSDKRKLDMEPTIVFEGIEDDFEGME